MDAFPKMLKHLLKRYFTSHPMAQKVDLAGKIAVVTGASAGSIGFITAETLASWGADVVVSTRSNTENLVQQLNARVAANPAAGKLYGCSLDLSCADSVQAFAQYFYQQHGKCLDILLNNAGIHLDLLSEWQSPRLTADQYEIHWRTNYLGTFHLTSLLLPALLAAGRNTGNARVVNVVSHLHTKGINAQFFSPPQKYNSWQAYGQSKLGLVHHAFELDRKYASQGVKGFAVHPGSIYTNIAHKGLDGHQRLQRIRNALAFIEKRILLTPEQGAQTQIMCATQVPLESGCYYQRCERQQPSKQALSQHVAQQLWDLTADWVASLQTANSQLGVGG